MAQEQMGDFMAALSGNLASSSRLFANRPFSGGHQTQLTTKLIPISRRDRDKPRQGVVGSWLNLFPNGVVGFIDWSDAVVRHYGRGAGVGRGLGVGANLGVGEGLGVKVGVAVGVAVAVGDGGG